MKFKFDEIVEECMKPGTEIVEGIISGGFRDPQALAGGRLSKPQFKMHRGSFQGSPSQELSETDKMMLDLYNKMTGENVQYNDPRVSNILNIFKKYFESERASR